MNPINICLCKGLWDNFDKCGHEADLTELSVMFLCSQGTASCLKGGQAEMTSLTAICDLASSLKYKCDCTENNNKKLMQTEQASNH